MQGLAAITANNGWAMAATGACIVITGLSVLSLIISQLHKIVGIIEKKEKSESKPAPEVKAAAVVDLEKFDKDTLSDLEAAAQQLLPFTKPMGDTFKLADLYKAMNGANHPHPHITVRELMNAGYLAPAGEGSFAWKNI